MMPLKMDAILVSRISWQLCETLDLKMRGLRKNNSRPMQPPIVVNLFGRLEACLLDNSQ